MTGGLINLQKLSFVVIYPNFNFNFYKRGEFCFRQDIYELAHCFCICWAGVFLTMTKIEMAKDIHMQMRMIFEI